jgi:hypothetical protein
LLFGSDEVSLLGKHRQGAGTFVIVVVMYGNVVSKEKGSEKQKK